MCRESKPLFIGFICTKLEKKFIKSQVLPRNHRLLIGVKRGVRKPLLLPKQAQEGMLEGLKPKKLHPLLIKRLSLLRIGVQSCVKEPLLLKQTQEGLVEGLKPKQTLNQKLQQKHLKNV